MNSRKTFWVSMLLLAILGLQGCPVPPGQQKAGDRSSQQQEEKPFRERSSD